jgi:hypothetical protein
MIIRRTAPLLTALAVAAVVSGCKARPDDAGLKADNADPGAGAGGSDFLDVNDVSILFPRDANGEPVPRIDVKDVWMDKHFNNVLNYAKDGIPSQNSKTPTNGLPISSAALDQKIQAGFLNGLFDSGKKLAPLFKGRNPFAALEGHTGKLTKTGIDFDDDLMNRDNWRIVGMRFDPCAPSRKADGDNITGKGKDPQIDFADATLVFAEAAGNSAGCRIQVRLIAQPVLGGGDVDTAAHLVFTYGPLATDANTISPIFKEMMSGRDIEERDDQGNKTGKTIHVPGLQEIKAASVDAGVNLTTGAPLGVHPGLKNPTTQANVQQLVQRFIVGNIKERSRVARTIALMALNNGGPEPWIFTAGLVIPPLGPDMKPNPAAAADGRDESSYGNWVPAPIPAYVLADDFKPDATDKRTLDTDKVPFHMQISFIGSPQVRPLPPASMASTAPLFDQGSKNPAVAFRVEQPFDTHFFNADCVSCHTTQPRLLRIGAPAAASDTDLGALGLGEAGKKFQRTHTKKGITGYVRKGEAQTANWNVRNFGYFGGKPTVANRAVTETIEVAAMTNEFIVKTSTGKTLKPGFAGPAPLDCTASDDTVYRCFQQGGQDTQCFATCTAEDATSLVVPPVVTPDPLEPPINTKPDLPTDNPTNPTPVIEPGPGPIFPDPGQPVPVKPNPPPIVVEPTPDDKLPGNPVVFDPPILPQPPQKKADVCAEASKKEVQIEFQPRQGPGRPEAAIAVLTGRDAECLSRFMAGFDGRSFPLASAAGRATPLITCDSTQKCQIIIIDPNRLDGDRGVNAVLEGRGFRALSEAILIPFNEQGIKKFDTTGPGKTQARIICSQQQRACNVLLTKTGLPGGGGNPTPPPQKPANCGLAGTTATCTADQGACDRICGGDGCGALVQPTIRACLRPTPRPQCACR